MAGSSVQSRAQFAERAGPPSLAVTGRGEAFAPPDKAVVRLGAAAQSESAAAAQEQVNETIQKALKAVKKIKNADRGIRTARVSLSPVYSQRDMRDPSASPEIVGYRASQSLLIELDNLELIGPVLDAGVKAGANQIEGVSFLLKNDQAARAAALTKAVEDARLKANVMAEASGVQISSIQEITENGVSIMPPPMPYAAHARMAAMESAPTQVEPGQVQIEANVTVRYVIAPRRP